MICFVEGEKCADALISRGVTATTLDGGSNSKWYPYYNEYFKGKNIYIFPDNDDPGEKYANKVASNLHGVAKSVHIVRLPDLTEKGADIYDWFEAGHTVQELANLAGEAEEYRPEKSQAEEKPQLKTISALELQKAILPPVKFLVNDVLPEGTGIVSAPSKLGKSWLVLDMGLCIASGVPFMGHNSGQCGVLYLALEDSKGRLQNRMNKVLGGKAAPSNFYFSTEAPTLDNGLLVALDEHIKQHHETKLIIIDTLQKVRGQSLYGEGAYQQDYREMGEIKKFMDAKGLSVFFVHHNRKMKDDDDPFNMISGTNGIMGAADTVWVITKKKRNDEEATLHITGRDVAQSDTVIKFSKDLWKWETIGDADWLERERARLEYQDNTIVKTIKKLLDQSSNGRWDGTAKDLLTAGEYMTQAFLAPNAQKLGYAIKGLKQPLFDYDGIVYTSTSHGTAGKQHHFYYKTIPQFEELPDETETPFPNM